MLFFVHFHILSSPVPDFAPDFQSPECGQFGIHEWYKYHVFYPTRSLPKKEMTYESESRHGWPRHCIVQLTLAKPPSPQITENVSMRSTPLLASQCQRSHMPRARILP